MSKDDEFNPADDFGTNPLHVAAHKGYEKIFKIIFHFVDEKNPKDNEGMTPLHMAAVKGNEEICKMIIAEVREKKSKMQKWSNST